MIKLNLQQANALATKIAKDVHEGIRKRRLEESEKFRKTEEYQEIKSRMMSLQQTAKDIATFVDKPISLGYSYNTRLVDKTTTDEELIANAIAMTEVITEMKVSQVIPYEHFSQDEIANELMVEAIMSEGDVAELVNKLIKKYSK